MFQFRPFCNSDPPQLASIWRGQPPQRGVLQPVSVPLLEQRVFSKPYFDRHGLIVGTVNEEPVGFVHASFGPDDQQSGLCTEVWATQLLMVRSEYADSELPLALLAQGEQYLRKKGAKVLYAGGIYPLNGFYLGLYGGSELPGVLSSDPLDHWVRTFGYQEIDRVIIFQRNLATFKPDPSRKQRQLRREFVFCKKWAPPSNNWWEACTTGGQDRIEYALLKGRGGPRVASVRFWDVEPLASGWGLRTAGVSDLYVEPEYRRRGLAISLLTQAFKQLILQGITLIESQTMHFNHPAISLYGELGFEAVDCGYVFRKESTTSNGTSLGS